MILNAAQAEAVYSAMCALNNVSGQLDVRLGGVTIKETTSQMVLVTDSLSGSQEAYSTQCAFAKAYGLH